MPILREERSDLFRNRAVPADGRTGAQIVIDPAETRKENIEQLLRAAGVVALERDVWKCRADAKNGASIILFEVKTELEVSALTKGPRIGLRAGHRLECQRQFILRPSVKLQPQPVCFISVGVLINLRGKLEGAEAFGNLTCSTDVAIM